MPSQSQSRFPVRTLLVAIMILAPLSVFVALPWLDDQPDSVVFLFAGVAATLTVVAAFAFSILYDRKLDEWHRSGAQFSTQWGFGAGASIVALLLALPPFRDLVVSLASGLADAPNPDHQLVILAFVGGFIATVLTQALSTFVISIVWVTLKSRGPRDPA